MHFLHLSYFEGDRPDLLIIVTPPRAATIASYFYLVLPNVEPYRRRGWRVVGSSLWC